MAEQQRFSSEERAAVYRAIFERRDMRHFSGRSVSPETLQRLLKAAHAGPSVGLMQPWRFIRITDPELREAIYNHVQAERRATARALGQREEEFLTLKVEGIRECSELLVVSLMDQRETHVFGRRTMPHMDIASTACAIQNLWLAARAEGLGLGWVSLFEPDYLGTLLRMPAGSEALAILCLGPVRKFYDRPMLESENWARRQPLEDCVMENRWREE